MLTKLYDWMNQIDDWKVLLAAAVLGASAALIKALKKGYSWTRALFESAVAFVLCELTGSLLLDYTSFSTQVIFGVVGVVGLNSELVSAQIERAIAAVGTRTVREVLNDDAPAPSDPAGDNTPPEGSKNV